MSDVHPRVTTTGLSKEAAALSVAKFFAGVPWEPPKLDPHFLTAAVFFEKVAAEADDAGIDVEIAST